MFESGDHLKDWLVDAIHDMVIFMYLDHGFLSLCILSAGYILS